MRLCLSNLCAENNLKVLFICDEIFSYPEVRLKLIPVSSLTLFQWHLLEIH